MANQRRRYAPLITALEPRMLLDGAALAEASKTLTDTQLQHAPAPDTTIDAALQGPTLYATALALGPSSSASSTSASTTASDTASAETPMADPAHQVVVVDASVPFADQLLATIPPEWTVISLQAGSDGLSQLDQA